MNADELHIIFRSEADALPVGPAPRIPELAAAHRRRRIGQVAVFAVAVIAVLCGGYAVASFGGSNPVTATEPTSGPMEPTPSEQTQPTSTSDDTQDPSAPTHTLDCGSGGTRAIALDWVSYVAPTPRGAAEQLLQTELADAVVAPVAPNRRDVAILDSAGDVHGVIVVVLNTEGDWEAAEVQSCVDDPLILPK